MCLIINKSFSIRDNSQTLAPKELSLEEDEEEKCFEHTFSLFFNIITLLFEHLMHFVQIPNI